MLSDFYPTLSGVLILGKNCHGHTAFLWSAYRLLATHDGHSGYEFPWSMFNILPFGVGSDYHDYHHSHNDGNYSSSFSIWDTIFDSNSNYYAKVKKEEE